MENSVKFKVGEIEYEASGDPAGIEQGLESFITRLLPLAINATKAQEPSAAVPSEPVIVREPSQPSQPEPEDQPVSPDPELERYNLASYIKQKGADSNSNFVLCAAYFDEKKNGAVCFSSDTVKDYYRQVRRALPQNVSGIILHLAKKGLVIDSPDYPHEMPKKYILSDDGIAFVQALKPKMAEEKRKPPRTRSTQKAESDYAAIDLVDLNLSNYPSVKEQKSFKAKMMLILYIITNEGHGEWFTVNDVACLMTDIFGEAATIRQIKGVFERETTWFKSENIPNSNKRVRRKLLNQGKDYVIERILGNFRHL